MSHVCSGDISPYLRNLVPQHQDCVEVSWLLASVPSLLMTAVLESSSASLRGRYLHSKQKHTNLVHNLFIMRMVHGQNLYLFDNCE